MALTRLVATARALRDNHRFRTAGILVVSILSLVFLGLTVMEAGTAHVLAQVGWTDLALIGGAGLSYGLLLLLLARSWSLAPGARGATISLRQAIAVYGTSILPKYVPGSILQYGSRQVLGQRLGWSQVAMAQGSVLEVALHVVCPLAVALLLLAPARAYSGMSEPPWLVFALVAALVAALVVLALVRRHLPTRVVITGAMLQLLFFSGLAALAALCGWSFGVAQTALPLVGGLFLLSWLAGFVVPLAPGGLGIREASGVAMLSGVIGVEPALLVLAAMRLVSLLGDVALFAAGLACQQRLHLRP